MGYCKTIVELQAQYSMPCCTNLPANCLIWHYLVSQIGKPSWEWLPLHARMIAASWANDCHSMTEWLQLYEIMIASSWENDCHFMWEWLQLHRRMIAISWDNDCYFMREWLPLHERVIANSWENDCYLGINVIFSIFYSFREQKAGAWGGRINHGTWSAKRWGVYPSTSSSECSP